MRLNRLTRATAAGAMLLAAGAALGGCRERAAKLMGVDSSAPPPVTPAEEPNQVHFAFTGPTSVTFSWRGSGQSLRIWSKDMPPRTIQSHAPEPKPFSTAGLWQEATVTDLAPDTEYGYEVGRPRRPVPAFLRTPPTPGQGTFSFMAAAGMGATVDFPEVRSTHRLIARAKPAFVLGLGDLTYADIRTQVSVDRHFEDIMEWSLNTAYLPVWGEREWQTPSRDDLRNYKGRFALPNPQTSPGAPGPGCCGEDWYWFDYGNVRFISYPEPYAEGTWDDWARKAAPLFEEAERSPALTFTITMGHRPAYSSTRAAGDARLRALLDGFGARYRKYVLNLSGHAPAYERTKPQSHVVHVSTSIASGDLEHADTTCSWGDCKAPPFTAFRAIHHGFVRVWVRPRSLRVDATCVAFVPGRDDVRCPEGDIFDTFVIDAPPDAPQARSGPEPRPPGP
jgi:hypothetical protein